MSVRDDCAAREQGDTYDRFERASEERTREELRAVRAANDEWESYGLLMRDQARFLEEMCLGDDQNNFFVQRRHAARREVTAFVNRLVREQVEMFAASEQEIRARSDAELTRLQQEKAGVVWG